MSRLASRASTARSPAAAVALSALLVAPILVSVPLAPPAVACTTFCLRDGDRVLFGKNYDWTVGDGHLLVNPRGVRRAAAVPDGDIAAEWTSRFGSVTFNQYGRGRPSGGMNEAGLAIELMWLEGSRYPDRDARPAVGVLAWIQYQLDTAGSVADVIQSDGRIRIAGGAPLHYLVADASGAVAAIEFLDGAMVAHSGDALPVAALANTRYADALRGLEGAGGPSGAGTASRSRFERAARRAEAFVAADRGDADIAYAFETLDRVAQPSTQWSIVYELDRRVAHFRTRGRRDVRRVRLAELDLGCAAPAGATPVPLGIELDAAPGAAKDGDLAGRLRPMTDADNLTLVRAAFRGTPFLAGAGEEAIRAQAADDAVCAAESAASR